MKKLAVMLTLVLLAGPAFAGAGALKLSLWGRAAVAVPNNIDDVKGLEIGIGSAADTFQGVQFDLLFAQTREDMKGLSHALVTFSNEMTGLQGGHSGTEIDKGRGNANVLLARVLSALHGEVHYRIVSLEGGEKDNAIPTWSRAELLVPFEKTYKLEEICAVCGEELKKEYALTDPELQVQFQYGNETGGDAFDEKSTETSLALLLALPNGVQAMSKDIPGLVETSLNLGIMRTDEKGLALSYALRSSVEAEKKHLTGKIKILTEYMGGIAETGGIYPAWEYRRDSGLREDMVRIYEKMFGKKPEIQVIHAGLECGILAAKIPNLDCVSMGPEIQDIHTAEERMSISSVRRMWEYILEIVKTKR